MTDDWLTHNKKEQELLNMSMKESFRQRDERIRKVMKEEVIKELKTVYDPEMPSINIFDLGLVYDIDIKEKDVTITHTLTSMFCPMADEIQRNIQTAVERVEGVGLVKVKLTHTPPFTREMMSEEARMALNL